MGLFYAVGSWIEIAIDFLGSDRREGIDITAICMFQQSLPFCIGEPEIVDQIRAVSDTIFLFGNRINLAQHFLANSSTDAISSGDG